MGLGPYLETSVANARKTATEAQNLLSIRVDPIAERDRKAAAILALNGIPNFEVAAYALYNDIKPSFRNPKHSIATLETHAFPILGSKKVNRLKVADFAEVLKPIWLVKPETA